MEITLKEFLENKNLDKSEVVALRCSYNQLKELPDLSSLVNLTHLNCSGNQLKELPDLSNLVNLIQLDCYNNQLKELPDLSNLVNLTHLNCSNNQLKELPDLSNLVDLTGFCCSFNQLKELPDLSNLVNLTELYCFNNQLKELPDLSVLINLTYLYCYNNQLKELPDLSNLVNLIELYCSNNQLTTIPQSIVSCRRLRHFSYNNNPIDYIPPNIQRFIQRMRNVQTVGNVYNDSQSVHRSSVTNSVKKSIECLMNGKTSLSTDKLITIILENTILAQDIKSRIIQYIEDKEELIHSMVTFEDLLTKVISRILNHSDPDELFRILNEQMKESECMCLTGRMSRLISVLDGFFDDIRIEVSSS